MQSDQFTVAPIGEIHVQGNSFKIQLAEKYRSALTGLEGFSHALIFWWCHLHDNSNDRAILSCESPYLGSPNALGVFATRSPHRPNPIAVTPVTLLDVDVAQGELSITWIDAENRTPVLDIKPYHPSMDRLREVTTPSWCRNWPQWLEDSASFDWSRVFINAE